MRPYRNLKLASLIQEELSKLLLKEVDIVGALVTITGVEVANDLSEAKVKLSILPVEKGPEVFMMIEEQRRELQHKLLKKLNVKPMPRLRFEIVKE